MRAARRDARDDPPADGTDGSAVAASGVPVAVAAAPGPGPDPVVMGRADAAALPGACVGAQPLSPFSSWAATIPTKLKNRINRYFVTTYIFH